MTQQPVEPLSDIASRLLHDSGFVATYYESPRPGEPRPDRCPARVSCLTPKGEAALDYADAMDQLVLQTYARVRERLGDTGHAQIIWRRRGEPVDPAELEPCFEGLMAQGYLGQTATGYALTPAGQAAVTACDQAHLRCTARLCVIDPSRIDRRTRDEARELAMHRRREALATGIRPCP